MPQPTPNPEAQVVVLCPLRFEQKAMRKSVSGSDCAVECCGPGEAGINRWVQMQAPRHDDFQRIVILAGLAGSLRDDLVAGGAHVIEAVRSDDGETWSSPLTDTPGHAVITSRDSIIATPQQRSALAQRTGAWLVDMESVAFARGAAARGWTWGIVRGISDDAATRMPAGMQQWLSASGRTRWLAVLADIAQKPSLVRDLRCLRDNSQRALAAAARLVAEMIERARKKR
jgi:hypothetical protein